MKQFFLLIFFSAASFLYGQQSRLFKLYYGINETVPFTGFAALDSLTGLYGDSIFKIRISGYADFLGSAESNLALSQKRAEALRQHLVKSVTFKRADIVCKGFGERVAQEQDLKLGDPASRLVEVEVFYASTEKKKMSTLPVKKIPSAESTTPPVTIKGLDKLKKGESMAIENLSFIPGRHIWLPSSKEALTNLLYTLQQHPGLKVEIQGHICCIYSDTDALDFDTNEKALSTNRARAVYDYLIKNGIDAGRLQYKGYARSQPKVQEERTSADEQTNRRVEIKILDL